MKVPSPNHWTIRELPDLPLMKPQPLKFVNILRGSQARNRESGTANGSSSLSPRSSGERICFDDWLINTSSVSGDQSLGTRISPLLENFTRIVCKKLWTTGVHRRVGGPSCVRIFVTAWTAARQTSLSLTSSQSPNFFIRRVPQKSESGLVPCRAQERVAEWMEDGIQ